MSFICTEKEEQAIVKAIKKFFRKNPEGDVSGVTSAIAEAVGNKDAKLEDYSNSPKIVKELRNKGIKVEVNEASTTSYKSNVIEEISSLEVSDLFHGLEIDKMYFEGYVREIVINNFLYGKPDQKGFVESDEQLTKNFVDLKNTIYKEIQEFLIKKNIISHRDVRDLYSDMYAVKDYTNYKNIMEQVKDYFFNNNDFELIQSYTGKKVPRFLNTTPDLDRKAYYNMIILANFDSVINNQFSNIISINSLYYNDLTSPLTHDKYKRVFKPENTLYWTNDSHGDEGVEMQNVKVAEMIIKSIPMYSKQDTKTDFHMEVKDFYLLAAAIADYEIKFGNKLKNNFENTKFEYFSSNVSERLDWYLQSIKDAEKNPLDELSLGVTFNKISNITNSIRQYLQNPELNIKEKESNSKLSITAILGQIINNSFGATYQIVDVDKGLITQQMYSQDFNSTGMNNTLYSKMLANAHNKSYYDLKNSLEAKKFNDIFKNLDPEARAVTVLGSNASFNRMLKEYISQKVGVKLNYDSLKTSIESMEKTAGAKGNISVADLKKIFTSFIESINSDFNSKEFIAMTTGDSRASNFDASISTIVSNSINDTAFQGISQGFLMDMPVKAVMNVRTADGNNLPSFKTANLTYKDTELFDQQRKLQENTLFQSLLIQDTPAILGTSTKLEVYNPVRNKSASNLTPMESLTQDIKYEFFENLLKADSNKGNASFNVIIGAYSDKSTILTKMISALFAEGNDKTPVIKRSMDDLFSLIRNQSKAYYEDTIDNTFNTYNNVFSALNLFEGQLVSKLSRSSFENSIKTINNILGDSELILNALSIYENGITGDSIEDIRKSFEGYNAINLLVAAKIPNTTFTEELHYSKYRNGFSFNQLIYDNYKIYSSEELFNEFIKRQENILIDNYNAYNVSTSSTSDNFFREDDFTLTKYAKALNIDIEGFKNEDLNKMTLSNGSLNPLIKKWMWINTLFRNEYLYISTKGEYMHPYKGPNLSRFGKSFDTDYWNAYHQESSSRLKVMSKRNVTNTSTYEAPVRDDKYTVPTHINMASIEDFKTSLYLMTGDKSYKRNKIESIYENKAFQDAHDGSSWLDYTYSKMVDASYPTKGYEGTKKQFGTFVGPNSVTIKKDAESVITNRKILESSNNGINLLKMKKKMLSININDLNLSYEAKLQPNFFYNERGELRKITNIVLEKNPEGFHELHVAFDSHTNGNWIAQNPQTYRVDNLFQMWKAFGGEYSTDKNGEINDGSNDLLYDVITESIHTEGGKEISGALKSKMIHIIANHSSLKAGATNLNPSAAFTNDRELIYNTYESRFMGPQLDASHSANDSSIKEVTQIISAIAQGGHTAEIAREAYEDIQSIINESARKYLNVLAAEDSKFYDLISKNFIKAIYADDKNSIAQTLITNLRNNNIRIPFSHQHFYTNFVKDVITRMNNDFISRNYPGLGAILVPSEGIVKLYDVPVKTANGVEMVAASRADLVMDALKDPNKIGDTNDEIVENYLVNLLPPTVISVSDIKIGDTISLDDQIMTLTTPEDYYMFKDNFLNNRVSKVASLEALFMSDALNLIDVEEDLTDAEISLKEAKLVNSLLGNVGDGDILANLELLTDNLLKDVEQPEGETINLFEIFLNKFLIYGDVEGISEQEADAVINIFEDLFLINSRNIYEAKNTASYGAITKINNMPRDLRPTLHTFKINGVENNIFDLKGVRFKSLLQTYTDLNNTEHITGSDLATLQNLVAYVSNKYAEGIMTWESLVSNKAQQNLMNAFLTNWKQRDLDLLNLGYITGDVNHRTDFNKYFENDDMRTNVVEDVLEYHSINSLATSDLKFRSAEIMVADIFKNKFSRDDTSLFNIKKQGFKYFEKFIKKQYSTSDYTNADIKIVTSKLNSPVYIRFTNNLKKYNDNLNIKVDTNNPNSMENNIMSRHNDQGEPIYDLVSDYVSVIKEGDAEIILIDLGNNTANGEKEIKEINNRVSEDLRAVITSFEGSIETLIPLMREDGIITRTDISGETPVDSEFNLNALVSRQFKIFTGSNYNLPLKKNSYINHVNNFSEELAKKKFASWEKSHDIVSSRIPAQSMQSFMPMQVVGYTDGSKNDAYVSTSQILLQGSDFDIDKAYLLGHSFSNNGLYNNYSKFMSYSTKGQLDALDALPMPKKRKLKLDIDPTNTEKGSINIDNLYVDFLNSGANSWRELSVESIGILNKIIRTINSSRGAVIKTNSSIESENYTYRNLVSLLNRYNNHKGSKEEALKNGVVSKINRVISSVNNQLMANSPVSIEAWHDAVAEVKKNRGPSVKDALVMSPNDVLSYYIMQHNAAVGKDDVGIVANAVKAFFGLTDYYNHTYRNTKNIDNLIKSGALFEKTFSFYDSKGDLKSFTVNSIADIRLNNASKEAIFQAIGKNFNSIQSDAALGLSGLLSAATDNAKELLMSKVNADKDLTSMHSYLLIMGLDIESVVEIMTSQVVEDILRLKESNIFVDTYENKLSKVLNTLKEDYKGNEKLSQNLATFTDIYAGAQELTSLSRVMGVNKKQKANTSEVYKFLNNLETVFNNANSSINRNLIPGEKGTWEDLVNDIVQKNPMLKGKEDYVLETLIKSTEARLDNESSETYDLVRDGMDFRLYTNNENYKKAVKKYFGLIKHTFNIFEIVDSIPHYKAMIDSLILTNNILSRSSKKYNFVINFLKDTIKKGENNVNGLSSKYINEDHIRKGIHFYDSKVAESWLKTISSEYSFSVKSLMELAGVDSYKVYTSYTAKDGEIESGSKQNVETIQRTVGKDAVVSLDSSYNIAQFKKLVEELILPIIQRATDNSITEKLKVESVNTPFRTLGTGIVSTFPLKELNNPVYAKNFQNLLSDFDSLDNDSKTRGLFKNSYGKDLKIRDIFYIYNLITNNERVGDKRLTSLFQNYYKEYDNLTLDYLKHWEKIESGEIDIWGDLTNEENLENIEHSLLFHIANDKGNMAVKKGDEYIQYNVSNSQFTLITDVGLTAEKESLYKNLNEVLSAIKSKGFLVYLKC